MGIKGLRNLSALLLASAALVGCESTPTKDRSIITPKAGDQPIGLNQQNRFNQTGQPVGTANANNNPFPTNNSNNLQPIQGVQGQNQPGSNLNPSLNQGTPPVGMLPQGRFPSMDNNNVQMPTNTIRQQAPSVPSNFGDARFSQPGVGQPGAVQMPADFPPR